MVLGNAKLKCWGGNGAGQLGLGDQNNRGDNPAEMGMALPSVDLGGGPSEGGRRKGGRLGETP